MIHGYYYYYNLYHYYSISHHYTFKFLTLVYFVLYCVLVPYFIFLFIFIVVNSFKGHLCCQKKSIYKSKGCSKRTYGIAKKYIFLYHNTTGKPIQ